MELNEKSIVYSGGVGEDISFYLLLHDKYGCNIVLLDPTKKAIKHYEEVKDYFNSRSSFRFTGNIQPDYISHLTKIKNFNKNKFHYI